MFAKSFNLSVTIASDLSKSRVTGYLGYGSSQFSDLFSRFVGAKRLLNRAK